MKLIAASALICFSFVTNAQDIKFKLAGATQKKWIGSTMYITASEENLTDLTFYKNLSVVEENRKYNNKKPAISWHIIRGEYPNDPQSLIQVGNRKYHVEFSTTNNGKDFLTLTSEPEKENEDIVIKTFYAE